MTSATGSTADSGPATSGGTIRTVGYAVTGAGVLALGGGLLMGSKAKSQESTARDKCRTILTVFTCPESSRQEFETAQQKARTANVLMIAGGVVAAGGVAMIVFGGPKPARGATAALRLTPLIGQHDAGLFAQGTF
jgi:hypothetical protein